MIIESVRNAVTSRPERCARLCTGKSLMVVLCSASAILGCARQLSTTKPSASPSADLSVTKASSYLVRDATAADLKLSIAIVSEGRGGFPDVSTAIENISNGDVIFPYGPGSVTVHVGSFAINGGPRSFQLTRQVLSAGDTFLVDGPLGQWIEIQGSGGVELMRPIRLPAGRYKLWASFYIGKEKQEIIVSEHQPFIVAASPGE